MEKLADCSPDPACTLPSVSVVIPAFNAERYLAECLDSILSQHGSRFEVIVVDDGSTDGTRDVAMRYGSRIKYVFQKNSGGGAAPRNAGARIAAGELLTFFDADDVMAPGKLQAQSYALHRYPEIGCVVTDYRNFGPAGAAKRSHFETCSALCAEFAAASDRDCLILSSQRARALLTHENFSGMGALMLRRKLFLRIGGFDENLTYSEDVDLLYRTALSGALGVVRQIGFARRLHESNMSLGLVHMLQQKARSRAKLARLEPHAALRFRLEATASEYHLALAETLARQGHTWKAFRTLTQTPFPAAAGHLQAIRTLGWCIAGPFLQTFRLER